MPNTPNISLDIRLGGGPVNEGWVNVLASNGSTTYGYKYTGGDDGVGGLVQTAGPGQSRDTAPLQLVADRRYHIDSVPFTNDTNSQLSWSGQSAYAGSIVDQNSAVETAKYSVIVSDTGNGNCMITCDPTVKNQPPA
jgi:hypothetical protein